jgi:hypothetical protein
MASFHELIGAPFGGISVRFSGDCPGLRLVRRSLDQTELDIEPDEQVDGLELVQGFLDEGCAPAHQVRFEVFYAGEVGSDGDEGTCSLNFVSPEGLASVCVLEDRELLRRRAVALFDPHAELNALLKRERPTLLEAIDRDLIPEPVPIASPFAQGVESSPRGGVITAAFAWKSNPGSDHRADYSVYLAAERAAFVLG